MLKESKMDTQQFSNGRKRDKDRLHCADKTIKNTKSNSRACRRTREREILGSEWSTIAI